MKRILLPTDFSDNSKNAILYAMAMFKGEAVTFYFLNVQKSSEYVTDDILSAKPGSSVYEAILADNEAKLKAWMAPIQQQFEAESFSFEAKVDFDSITDAISQAVKLYEIDLIIMGTNGATDAAEKLFGSNTLKVMREVKSPVLAIPEDYSFTQINAMVFSLHHGDELSREDLEPLFSLLKHTNAQLEILDIDDDAIAEPTRQEDHNIATAFEGIDYSFHALTGIPTPVGIDAFVQLFPVGLHAMFTTHESFLERFIFGSETSQISYHTRVPLLILKQH
ncbi:universal stress protein [Luteirhabdus pelagi]|uniref:universal stress protein n=1 Tax=Luteirhabdus pelagi TaxID=2792783 RepID=UPI00193A8067|nr:universal stress protein [Luteirhabdus pelagi]